MTAKDVLASISRLRGAHAAEIAADLGEPVDNVVDALSELGERGQIRLLQRGVPIGAAGIQHFTPDQLTEGVFDVTFRGFVELKS